MALKTYENRAGLCVTRRKGETVCIGEDIEITITELRHTDVGLRIRAPKDVLILRKELRGTGPRPETTIDHLFPTDDD